MTGLVGCAAAPPPIVPPPNISLHAKVLDLDGVKVTYLDKGAGEPMLLISPGLLPADIWKELQDRLAPRFRVIAVDAPDLSGALGPSYTTERLLELYRDFMKALEIPAAHIVGASIGGGLAVALGHHYPEKTLTVTSIGGFEVAGWREDLQHTIERLSPRTPKQVPRFFSVVSLRYGDGRVPIGLADALTRGTDGKAADRSYRRWAEATMSDIRSGYIASMAELLEAPVLLIAGDQDSVRPADWDARAQWTIGNVTTARIPKAGHLAFLDQPDLVATEIARFVQQQSGSDWIKRHFGF